MVFVYIRIYYAAKARARRGIRKPPRRQAQEALTSFSNNPEVSTMCSFYYNFNPSKFKFIKDDNIFLHFVHIYFQSIFCHFFAV